MSLIKPHYITLWGEVYTNGHRARRSISYRELRGNFSSMSDAAFVALMQKYLQKIKRITL